MPSRTPPGESAAARSAWARFRKLMLWMGVATLVVVGLALTLLYRDLGYVSIHFFIATGLGVGIAMMLMAGLMGLVFMSNSGGHDEGARRSDSDQDPGGSSR